MKKRIFDIIQIGNKDDLISRSFDIFIVVVIIANITSMFLETFDQLSFLYDGLVVIEYVTTVIFCIEYALRIYTAQYLYPQKSEGKARMRFMLSFDGIIDLLTIIPFFFLSGFIAFRMLRVVRIFHLFRINTQYDSFNVIISVLYEKKNQILSSVFIIIILMLASSLGMYSAEHVAQPNVFNNAFSGIWWSASTVLTVGYGDIYPITVFGKMMAIVISFLGVGVVAIPTGIISAGFVEQYQQTQRSIYDKALDIKDIVEIQVDATLADSTIRELQDSENMSVYLIIRGELTLLPKDEVVLQRGDILVARVHEMSK